MNKTKRIFLSLVAVFGVAMGTLGFAPNVDAYEVNTEFKLDANEGSPFKAENRYIIAHETANPTATGRNEATYMNRNWFNAYTQYIVGDGIVYQIGEPGYISYGAGAANIYAPVQIELQHTTNKELFKKNYKVYIELIRDSAKRFGIPLNVDPPFGQKGVVSHEYISKYIWGDHTDPYGYLAKMGISRAQFAKDVKNGLGNSGSNSNNSNTNKPTPAPSTNYKISNINKYYKTKEVLNVRKNPTANSAYVGTVAKNQTVKVDKVAKNGQLVNGNKNWYHIAGKGWVTGAYVTETKKPSTPVTNRFVKEHATFTVTVREGIKVRSGNYGVNATYSGLLKYGQSIVYDGYIVSGGYVWVHYVGYNGKQLWLPVREVNKPAWGTFK